MIAQAIPDLVSQGRLNRMLKYFRGKSVVVSYHYNNSLCMHEHTEYRDEYDDFEVETQEYASGKHYAIRLRKGKKLVFEQDFGDDAYFTGLGQIEECNSGPYCYFSIRRYGMARKIKHGIVHMLSK